MKKLIFLALVGFMVGACSTEKSVEERYLYEGDKIVDVETGDEYILDEKEEVTVTHKDGTTEKVKINETPFYGTAIADSLVQSWEANFNARQERLIEEKRDILRQARKQRYASLSDDELMQKFQDSHKRGDEMSLQMDMMGELVERGAVSADQVPDLLEISPDLVDLDIEINEDATLENNF
jgi:hypothetical protein